MIAINESIKLSADQWIILNRIRSEQLKKFYWMEGNDFYQMELLVLGNDTWNHSSV